MAKIHMTNTVQNSPAQRAIERKIRQNERPDPVQLMLLRDILRRTEQPGGSLKAAGLSRRSAGKASDFLQQYAATLPTADPGSETPLPGLDWLGYGYRPFGRLLDLNCASDDNLFEFPDWDRHAFKERWYPKPAVVRALNENDSFTDQVEESSLKDTLSNLYIKVAAGVDYKAFKGEAEFAFSRSIEKHWEYRCAAVLTGLRMLRLTLPGDMRQYLKPEARSAIDNAAEDAQARAAGNAPPHGTDFDAFFEKWGTHYISGVHLGGLCSLYMTFHSTDYKSSAQISAKCAATYSAVKASAETDISNATREMEKRSELHVAAWGGYSQPENLEHLAEWRSAVAANPGVMSFYGDQMQGLTPIYMLVADPVLRKALADEWNTYCAGKHLGLREPGPTGQVVTAIRISADKKRQKALAKARAGGFTEIGVDLNKGSGGHFIYAAMKRGDGDKETPLRDLVCVTGSSTVTAPLGYTKDPTDLNKGCGGDFIYLCSTSEADSSSLPLPIRQVVVEDYAKSRTVESFTARGLLPIMDPDSATPKPLDLNRSVKGRFVYMAFTRETPAGVKAVRRAPKALAAAAGAGPTAKTTKVAGKRRTP